MDAVGFRAFIRHGRPAAAVAAGGLVWLAPAVLRAQSIPPQLPEAPEPQAEVRATVEPQSGPVLDLPPLPPCSVLGSSATPARRSCLQQTPGPEAYRRFVNSPAPLPLTPAQKFKLAVHNVRDPFNLLTIAGLSAIDVASDADNIYGPGFGGFAKETGTVLTETINGEFWGTFVVASLAHQDPHYHRMPGASLPRRALHCITAVVVGQSDTGRPMFNFVEAGGYAISSSINNLYVPYRSTTVSSTTARVTTAMALDPIGNAITEFLPDLAKKINVKAVFLQQIINKVAAEEAGSSMSGPSSFRAPTPPLQSQHR